MKMSREWALLFIMLSVCILGGGILLTLDFRYWWIPLLATAGTVFALGLTAFSCDKAGWIWRR